MKCYINFKSFFSFTLSIIIVVGTIIFCVPSASASYNTPYSVDFDNDTKIISNIDTAKVTAKSYSLRGYTKSINGDAYALLNEVGFSDEDIENLPDERINDYLNAQKIYSVVKEIMVEETSGTRTSIDPGIIKTVDNVKLVFTVIQSYPSINGKATFKIEASAKWNNAPTWRFKDILAMAWTSNAIGCGSSQSNATFTYSRNWWWDGVLKETLKINADSSQMEEINNFPYYAVKYDLPANTLLPNYKYSGFDMYASTKVTATDDFVACSSYGHQVVAGNSSVSFSSEGGEVGIDFDLITDEYYAGVIRVYI